MISLNVIRDALARHLKNHFPGYTVSIEDPDLTKAPLLLVQILPGSQQTVSAVYTDRSILFDIGCLTKKRSRKEYFDIADKLDWAIRPVFHFADRHVTVHSADSRIADGMLHYTFFIGFRDSVEQLPDPETRMCEAGGLEFTIKGV